MDKIGPREAADTIRADYQHEHVDPRFHHQVRFAGDVLSELGEEKTPETVARVMRLLDKAGIEGHAYDDYPKWVQNERGERAVVADEDHESEFTARPEPFDADGVANPEYGHVDPQTGEYTAGTKPTIYEPHSSNPPPYEPGAVPVFEPGGQKGPEASPVSDNQSGKPIDPKTVLRANEGKITEEPARKPNPAPANVDAKV